MENNTTEYLEEKCHYVSITKIKQTKRQKYLHNKIKVYNFAL